MPYLVFAQAVRIASEERERIDRETLQRQAHLGWQLVGPLTAALGAKGSRPPTFDVYLRRLGLQPKAKLTRAQLQAEREAGAKAADRVREAFRQHGVRKADSG